MSHVRFRTALLRRSGHAARPFKKMPLRAPVRVASAPPASPAAKTRPWPVPGALDAVEAHLGVHLPAAVRRTLDAAARGATAVATADVARLRVFREGAQHLLVDSKAEYELRDADFVFLFDEYEFLFCPCDVGDDPPVYRFVEGERAPRLLAPSFAQWAAAVGSANTRLV